VRLRLLAALTLAFSIALVTTPLLVPVIAGLALTAARAAGMDGPAIRRALRLPGLLVLVLVILLPFLAGETVLWRLGPLGLHSEGLMAAVLVAGRALGIVLLTAALLARVPLVELIAGLRSLGLPALMADIALMMHRYSTEIRRDLDAMLLAMQLRGQPWRLRLGLLQGLGWTLATLLLRSHERAERIWTAMRLRGHGTVPPVPMPPLEAADLGRVVLLALPGPLLLVIERLL
jgi:cobalt/nickel transport system permease protein